MNEPTTQAAVRIPTVWLSRLDSLASRMAPPGIPVSRSAVIKAALSLGMTALEADYNGAAQVPEPADAPAPAASTKKPASTHATDERLRTRLAASGCSQAGAARAIGVSPSHVSRWANGGSLSEERRTALAAHLDELGF